MSDEKTPTNDELKDRINAFAREMIDSGRARHAGTTPDGGILLGVIPQPADPTGYILRKEPKKP